MDTDQPNQPLTKKEKYAFRQEQKAAEQDLFARKRVWGKTLKILFILIAVGFGVWGLWYLGTRPVVHRTNREVALSCTTDMATQFHIHPHLEIIINGKQQDIPANIGINLACMHPIHTHDASGALHVESPETRDFTLADFFAVWGKPFSKSQILDSAVDGSHIIKVAVNGAPVDTYENTVLRDKDQIVISVDLKN